MMIPSRRKLGAAALIIAGIGAFLVPFLLHSPATQGTSSNTGGTNPNNGSHTTTNPNPTPTTTTDNSGSKDDSGKDKGSGGTSDNSGESTDTTNTCSAQSSSHSDVSDKTDKASTKSGPSDNSEGNHGHAYGLVKHQMDKTVALVKSMGVHNSAFHAHHDTKTDNKTVHTEQASSESSTDHESSCAETEETNDD
jgi:hypothetical protein